ncbi:MAG TPA: MOSC N-terminal beta barrel domain-containing protein [Candidatus Limnocylindrales bacterium]|nr:MOSC N-terminal beta barrel domain-containing protein [Candidatus Limnocylindrales bacterium]
MPRISRISIAPVRGLALEHPESVDLGPTGVLEDRRFYLTDDAGRLLDRIRFGPLVRIGAHTDPGGSTLRLTFPDGEVVDGEVELGDPVETFVYNRLAVGHLVSGPWAEAIGRFVGRPVRLVRCDRPGGTRSRNAVSLIGDGSLAELAKWLDVSGVDGRRFRMLFEVSSLRAHEEDRWIGGRVAIGTSILSITHPDARCAITTQHPETGAPDLDTLRTIIAYRGLREGKKIDFGVLGEVVRSGVVDVGDEVLPLAREAGDEPGAPDYDRLLLSSMG